MIPYEELAAALERRAARPSADAAPSAAPLPQVEDRTLNGNEAAEGEDYEVGEVLSDEEAS